MQHDGRYMLDDNYASSKTLLDACMATGTRLFYASSAATYGGSSGSSGFIEHPAFERPLNVYGYSKLLFDQVVRRALPASRSQIAGFRYFNVYSPGEQHKGRMASVAYHHFNQFRADGKVQLFGSYGGYGLVSRCAISYSSTTLSLSICGSSIIQIEAACSTWDPAARSPSTTSRCARSTRSVRHKSWAR